MEEQNKNLVLRESLRNKEADLRRVEQEVDSLNFRNNQLEHRVAALQDDLSCSTSKKSLKGSKTKLQSNVPDGDLSSMVHSEEFQKKILECAQLSSSIADQLHTIQMQADRISELESIVRAINSEQTVFETKLCTDIADLKEQRAKVAQVEDAIGNDALFTSEKEQFKSMEMNEDNYVETRLITLQNEVIRWKTKYEVLYNSIDLSNLSDDSKPNDELLTLTPREKFITNHYAKKMKQFFLDNHLAESKLNHYMKECSSQKQHVDFLSNSLADNEKKLNEYQYKILQTEEDLVII